MHRSGTSALAGVLKILGLESGGNLMEAKNDNPKGFFENKKIVEINDAILHSLHSSADDINDLPVNWHQNPKLTTYQNQIKEVIRHEFAASSIFFLKDPRISILLPIYIDILAQMEIKPYFIQMKRSPIEVAESLKKRNGFKIEKSIRLYQKYQRSINNNVENKLTIEFNELINDTEGTINKIKKYIPEITNEYAVVKTEVKNFLDCPLKHHNISDLDYIIQLCDKIRGQKEEINILKKERRPWYKKLIGDTNGPDFLIIGGARCGTTSLFNYLSFHPQVSVSKNKELHFFYAGPDRAGDVHADRKTQAWYENQFKTKTFLDFALKRKKVKGEATPYYLFHPLVPEKVYRLYPEIKLIILLRDPLNRAVSHYYHYHHNIKNNPAEPNISIEDAFKRDLAVNPVEEQKIISDPNYYSYSHQHHSYVLRGDYRKQIARWQKFFPENQMLVLKSEEFYACPYQTLIKVCKFLKIKKYPDNLGEKLKIFNKGGYEPPSEEQRKILAKYFHYTA